MKKNSTDHFSNFQLMLRSNINRRSHGDLNDTAESAILRLNVASKVASTAGWLVKNAIRAEAVYSNKIAANNIDILNLLHHESQSQNDADHQTKQVCNTIEAYYFTNENLVHVFDHTSHARILQKISIETVSNKLNLYGKDNPSCIRKYSWSDDFFPPSIDDVPTLLSIIDEFAHRKQNYFSSLACIAIICAHFKIINPFGTGNRRIGRLLIPALLKEWNITHSFTLQMSKYFYENKFEYDNSLKAIYHKNEWNDWIIFFLKGIIVSANYAEKKIIQINNLIETNRHKLINNHAATIITHQLFNLLPTMPYFSSNQICQKLNITAPSANKAINLLVSFGFLKETSNKQRNRHFGYQKYIELLL